MSDDKPYLEKKFKNQCLSEKIRFLLWKNKNSMLLKQIQHVEIVVQTKKYSHSPRNKLTVSFVNQNCGRHYDSVFFCSFIAVSEHHTLNNDENARKKEWMNMFKSE